MKYQIEEFWLDEFPSGGQLIDLVEENHLKYYELFQLATEPKPYNPNMINFGTKTWHIIRFRKKVEE